VTGANLLTEHVPNRFSCHDLLRAYAAELCEAYDADRDAARHRLVDHYVHSAHAAALHLHGHVEAIDPAPPGPGVSIAEFAGPEDAVAWLTAEQSTLLATLKLAAEIGLDRQVGHLARALFFFLHRRGRWYDRAETQRAAVAAARRLGDPVEETRALRNSAWALADLGRFEDAHTNLDAALDLSQDDLTASAWTHYHRDLVYAIQGRESDALDSARRAHDLFDKQGDEVGRAVTLTELGWHHGRLGSHELARDYCERALTLHQRLGNRPYEAHTWSCLAEVLIQLGDLTGAVTCFGRAFELFRELGDMYAEASILAHVGACHRLAGDDAAAHEYWRRAHALLSELDPSTIDQIHTQLTTIDRSVSDAFLRSSRPGDKAAGDEGRQRTAPEASNGWVG
jgi:tetratricopeptide (TPR) repeat protein